MFKKYQHIEKFETMEVEGIELGVCFVFPKIDGTNGSVWLDEDDITIKTGSRNRELSLDNDNQGFYKHIFEDNDDIHNYLYDNPTHRLYGEWLVPHTLKTYKQDAWKKFYVFDIMVEDEYIPYDIYKPLLEEYNIDYVPAICSIKNGSSEQLRHQISNNVFLVEDCKGVGEGVVLKNYDYTNKYGRKTWAKIVRNDFKTQHSKEMGHPEMNGKSLVEDKIVQKYCDENLIEKTYAKIVNEEGGWSTKFIPRLFGMVWYDLINEEIWEILKDMKKPTINFGLLHNLMIMKIKETKPEIFS